MQDRALAVRGESPASHRDRRGARLTRREEGEYREYSTDEQRSQPGCIVGRMQRDFCHGLLVHGLGVGAEYPEQAGVRFDLLKCVAHFVVFGVALDIHKEYVIPLAAP